MPTYNINLNNKYGHLCVIDVDAEASAVTDQWFNQTLTAVNDCVVRLGVVQGEFHWHKHDNEDEFFFVLSGVLMLDVEGQDPITLHAHQGYTVPRGVLHRTRAEVRTVMLMTEAASVVPEGV